MKPVLLIFGLLLTSVFAPAAEDFKVLISREKVTNNLVTGSISVNGEKIGTCYERNDLKIAAGTYPGYLRYGSAKGFAQGPFGEMGQEGDFLLEIGKVKWSDGKERTNLLFHGGTKPEHSEGCIMLGAVQRDSSGKALLPNNHPLRLLRLKFYGTDVPLSSPNKKVTVTIKDISKP